MFILAGLFVLGKDIKTAQTDARDKRHGAGGARGGQRGGGA